MSIKTIFKVLLGTIVILVVLSLTVEIFNISTTGLQINQISRLAGKQACELFAQETYKQYDDGGNMGGTVNMYDIYDANGNMYVPGKFYDSMSPYDIYNEIYNSLEFRQWLNNGEIIKGNWYNLNLMKKAVNEPHSLYIELKDDGSNIAEYTEASMARMLRETMMTPLNIGVPYLDKKLVNKMFMWNLTQLMSNCKGDSILLDEDTGNRYVAFRGFKVFADSAYITDLEYKTFDLDNPSERLNFHSITNIDPDKIEYEYDKNLEDTLGISQEERNKVCLVGVKYAIPITYEGITPIKQVFNYVWNKEVEGMNDGAGRDIYRQWNEHIENLESGGLGGNLGGPTDGVLPVPGKLIYYVIR